MCNSQRHVRRNLHNDSKSLVSPEITGALDDGLLPVTSLTTPLKVNFPTWDDAIDKDSYQLKWDGRMIGEIKNLPTNPIPGTPLTLEIPVESWATVTDGEHQLGYISQRYVGGTPNDSPTITVKLDRLKPGGALIGPLIFPRLVNDGLTSDELTGLGESLVGEVPAYFDIKEGDVIRTYWAGVAGPEHTVVKAEVPGSGTAPELIMIPFTREFLEALGDIKEDVYYTVTDRAGNQSVDSQPVAFQLALHAPAVDLPEPLVPQADDGVISDADARMNVGVDIPAYGDVQVDDEVTVYWGANPVPGVKVEAGDETQNPVFTVLVPYDTVALTPDGAVDVYYEVRRNGVLFGTSAVTKVNVLLHVPGPLDPAAPIIRGASALPDDNDNVIDENDYLQPATAIIPWKAGYAVDDQINLLWGHQPIPATYKIKGSDVTAARDLNLTVPNTLIVTEGTGQDIRVNYTVTHEGNPNTANSPSQSVSVRRKGELPGGENGLQAPEFQRVTENGGIGAILNPNGATVLVKPYENIKAGDVLTFMFLAWKGFVTGPAIPEATYTFMTDPLTEEQTKVDYEFTVPDANLRLVCVGRAEATFRVDSITGPATSTPATVLIDMVTPGEGCGAK